MEDMNMARRIHEIAQDIRDAWPSINYAARPYLEALEELNTPQDHYFLDSGKEIALRFLCNATTFRGDTAKKLKAELKAAYGIK
jgi:hypothetical protein